MKRILHHLVFPAAIPFMFFITALTPVEVFGCRNRGLMVFIIALAGALAGLGSAVWSLVRKLRGDAGSNWFILSTIILALPAIFLILAMR